MIKTLLLGTALAFTANTAAAGCVANTDKSVAYCAGLLGMIYQNKGGQADAFLSNDYVESIATPADERCGYASPPPGQSAQQAGLARYEAGKRFYRHVTARETEAGFQRDGKLYGIDRCTVVTTA